jgi:hypothetical protein
MCEYADHCWNKSRKARKPHKCYECNKPIAIGETYTDSRLAKAG